MQPVPIREPYDTSLRIDFRSSGNTILPMFSPRVFSTSAILFVSAVGAQAVTVADFTGGNSNGVVDGFRGMAGQGWQAGWLTNISNTNVTQTVTNTAPLNGGGNYLSMSSTTSGTGSSATGWNRQYGGSGGGVSLSAAHTISWSFRVDEDAASLTSNFTQGTDRYQFFGTGASSNTTTTANEWFVFSSGATPATAGGNFAAGKWEFYSGGASSTAFDQGTIVDSGISMVSGTTYFFTITTDPTTRTYVGTVSDGVNSFTTGTLNWRNTSANPTASGGYFVTSLTSSAPGEIRSASLDSISIVPEPSSSLLLLGTAALLGTRRKRSH